MRRFGLGQTCQWPQPGVQMVYPPCDPGTMQGTQAPVFPVTTQPLPVAVAFNPGTFRFINLTTGNAQQFRTGDRWQVTITGASPNVSVGVQGGKNGARDIAMMGQTDAGGNFSLSGQITADQVGNWSEAWYVSSVLSGQINFTVAGDSAPPPTPQTQTTTQRSTATTPVVSSLAGFDPQTLMLIGGGILVLFLLMGRK